MFAVGGSAWGLGLPAAPGPPQKIVRTAPPARCVITPSATSMYADGSLRACEEEKLRFSAPMKLFFLFRRYKTGSVSTGRGLRSIWCRCRVLLVSAIGRGRLLGLLKPGVRFCAEFFLFVRCQRLDAWPGAAPHRAGWQTRMSDPVASP